MAKEKADTISGTENVLQAPQQPEINENEKQPFAPPTQTPVKPMKVPERKSRIFLLSNNKRKGTVILDVEEDVIDPATGKTRRMRLLRGAQSIWFDEQPPTVFPPNYVAKNTLSLQFNQGKCVIPISDTLRIKAAELTNRNTDNPHRNTDIPKDIYFYEWNPVAQAEKEIKEENDIVKAMNIAFTAPIEEVIPHAQYLGVQFTDEQGVQMDEASIRTAYAKVAKNHSKKFLSSLHSPTVKIAHSVRKAIADGKIDLGRQAGAAYWTDGGFISAVPLGRDAVDFLIEFAQIPGEANGAFQNQLRALTQ